jgi:predicted Ser/Thr protein kinase
MTGGGDKENMTYLLGAPVRHTCVNITRVDEHAVLLDELGIQRQQVSGRAAIDHLLVVRFYVNGVHD